MFRVLRFVQKPAAAIGEDEAEPGAEKEGVVTVPKADGNRQVRQALEKSEEGEKGDKTPRQKQVAGNNETKEGKEQPTLKSVALCPQQPPPFFAGSRYFLYGLHLPPLSSLPDK